MSSNGLCLRLALVSMGEQATPGKVGGPLEQISSFHWCMVDSESKTRHLIGWMAGKL